MNISREGFTIDLSKRILEPEEVITKEEGELYAKRLDDRSLGFKMLAFDIVERLNLSKDSKILEVCCGAGQLVDELSKLINPKNIIAIDGSGELINAAKERYSNSGVTFLRQNIHDMTFSQGEFDVIICKDSFHHFKDPVGSIEELMMPVKKGGYLYIFDLCRSAEEVDINNRQSAIKNDHEAMRFLRSLNASHTPEEFRSYAQVAGYSDVKIEYPIVYSKENIDVHKIDIKNDIIKEFKMVSLFSIYLIKK